MAAVGVPEPGSGETDCVGRTRRGDIHDPSALRLEHGGFAYHECVTLLLDVAEILCGEVRHLAPVLTLPRALLANVVGDDLVEGAVAADDEDVVVGDGAEGLVSHPNV